MIYSFTFILFSFLFSPYHNGMEPTAGAFLDTKLVRFTSSRVYLPHHLAAMGAFTLFDQSFLIADGAGGHCASASTCSKASLNWIAESAPLAKLSIPFILISA